MLAHGLHSCVSSGCNCYISNETDFFLKKIFSFLLTMNRVKMKCYFDDIGFVLKVVTFIFFIQKHQKLWYNQNLQQQILTVWLFSPVKHVDLSHFSISGIKMKFAFKVGFLSIKKCAFCFCLPEIPFSFFQIATCHLSCTFTSHSQK